MSGGHLPAKPSPSGLAFDPRSASPMVRRGMERLIAIVAAKEDESRLLWSFVGYGRHKTYEREPPPTLPVLAENIPEELKRLRQWVCWDWIDLDQVRWNHEATEQPIDPNRGGTSYEWDPSTWAGFDDAVAFAKQHELPGVGFVFTKSDPYTGIRLDRLYSHIHGGIVYPSDIIELFESYMEQTPTGVGRTIVVEGSLPLPSVSPGVRLSFNDVAGTTVHADCYDSRRFLPFTGHIRANSGTKILERHREVMGLYQR